MNKYRDLLWQIVKAFPKASDIKLTIIVDKLGAREFQEALNEELKTQSILMPSDIIDKQFNDKTFTQVLFPMLGEIKLEIE